MTAPTAAKGHMAFAGHRTMAEVMADRQRVIAELPIAEMQAEFERRMLARAAASRGRGR